MECLVNPAEVNGHDGLHHYQPEAEGLDLGNSMGCGIIFLSEPDGGLAKVNLAKLLWEYRKAGLGRGEVVAEAATAPELETKKEYVLEWTRDGASHLYDRVPTDLWGVLKHARGCRVWKQPDIMRIIKVEK